MALLILLWLVLLVDSSERPEVKLLNHLFKDYNTNALPKFHQGSPVNLSFDIALRQLLDLDEKKQIVETSTWIRHYWHDPFLVWNESDWGGIKSIAVSPDIVWKPDITLYNNAEKEFQGFDQFGKTKVNIYSSGSVIWLLPKILRSECKLQMTYFPFDSQLCPLTFGSWAYDGGIIDFHSVNPTGDMSSFSESGEFTISDINAVRVAKYYGCCPNPYITITFNIHLHRRIKFYLFNLIIPGVLIAILSCFSFFLPPLSGERAGLIITNFLSLSVYVLIVSDTIPPSSESVPLLVRFYTIIVVEIGLALCVNCVIIPLAARKTPVPSIVRRVFLQNHYSNLRKYLKKKMAPRAAKEQVKAKEKCEVIENSNGFQNLSFSSWSLLNEKLAERAKMFKFVEPDDDESAINKTVVRTDNCCKFGENIVEHLERISSILSAGESVNNNHDDWENVVRVVDRLFFIAFILVIILSAVFIFLSAPEIRM